MSISVTTHPGGNRIRRHGNEPLVFRFYAWALFFVVVLALGIRLSLAPDSIRASAEEIALWTILAALASLVPLTSGTDTSLAMDMPILLAAGFIHGPVLAAVVGLGGCLDARELKRQVSLPRALMNRAQISISAATAALVFESLRAHLGVWPWAALCGLLALIADCTVNYVLVVVCTILRTATPLRVALRNMHLGWGSAATFIPLYGCFGFLGVLMAEAYESIGFLGVVGFVAPIVLARQMFVQWQRLEETRTSLKSKTSALKRVDERIADERKDERARIASALHDEVLQSLYNVTIRTNVIREDLRSGRLLDLDDDVPGLLDASERAVDDLREVIGDLRRSTIGHAGLVDTLALLIAHLKDESRILFVSDLDTSVKADSNTELLIYQIAREAITNAIKHSRARTIWVTLRQDGSDVRLVIEDDGQGFDSRLPPDEHHFGLTLMRERAEMAGGQLAITSAVGSGTTLSLRVPSRI